MSELPDWEDSTPAELGAVSSNPRKKGDRHIVQARRDRVQILHKSGMSQRGIVKELTAQGFVCDAPMISNDLAYIARQTMESYQNADGTAIMADMMQDYVAVRRALYEVMTGAGKAADRVAASRTLLQLMNDFRTFLVTAKVISVDNARVNADDENIQRIIAAMDRTEDASSLYELYGATKEN
ncbi:hypothetical protein IHN63_00295 [Deinococcus sp. 6YEL10]|uniref:hypothetical protein n=1 Tax=Deinococcus sp. 6YEL10 TaxID=2745870 RepID=UPI001E44694D|nr:hypothetical protein [Deinococcus sp. 6YEL10]MCD0159738.1 hypothetical protein [Deinococcus sp. 6YEL10]